MLFLAFFLATLSCVNAQLSAMVLPQTFADIYGAKCLDGSPPAIYYKLGDPNRWILFLEGGGWCADTTYNSTVANCFGRAAGGGGSSNGIHNGSSMDVGGIMSTNPAVNPHFYNASLVFHHYCVSIRKCSSLFPPRTAVYITPPLLLPPPFLNKAGWLQLLQLPP